MTKQLVVFGTAVMTTLLALVALWQFRIVVFYVLVSLALAATVRPLVKRLVRRGFVVGGAWILLYLVTNRWFHVLATSSADPASPPALAVVCGPLKPRHQPYLLRELRDLPAAPSGFLVVLRHQHLLGRA